MGGSSALVSTVEWMFSVDICIICGDVRFFSIFALGEIVDGAAVLSFFLSLYFRCLSQSLFKVDADFLFCCLTFPVPVVLSSFTGCNFGAMFSLISSTSLPDTASPLFTLLAGNFNDRLVHTTSREILPLVSFSVQIGSKWCISKAFNTWFTYNDPIQRNFWEVKSIIFLVFSAAPHTQHHHVTTWIKPMQLLHPVCTLCYVPPHVLFIEQNLEN